MPIIGPKYASFTNDDPPIVDGFYDTGLFDYPTLPDNLVELNDEDWAKRMDQQFWTIVDGRLTEL